MSDDESFVHIPCLDAFGVTGVYFLYRDGMVVYVGQAVNIRRRIASHIAEGVKRFDSASFIRCRRDQLNSIERKYIALLGPEYNKCSVAAGTRLMPDYEPLAIKGPLTGDVSSRKAMRHKRVLRLRAARNTEGL